MSTRSFVLRLIEDRLPVNASGLLLPLLNRVVYVLEGEGEFSAGGTLAVIPAHGAWHGCETVTLAAGPVGAVLWRFELLPASNGSDGLLSGGGVASNLKLAQPIELDTAERYLLRCERVDFVLGARVPQHRHKAGGIRCVYAGEMRIDQAGASHRYRSGEAWYEAGPDAVIAVASGTELTGFVRAMVVPRSLKGQTTAIFEPGADQSFRRGARRLVDALIDL